MKYDFTSIIDRRGRDALAVDAFGGGFAPDAPQEGFDRIPMWVADMNFPTAPSIPAAIIDRAQHPLYGYFAPRKEYYESIIRWQKEGHDVDIQAPQIGYENGVLGGLVSACRAFAAPGDGILLHSPAYIGFTNTLKINGYRAVLSPLVRDEDGVWRMDYQDMERKIRRFHLHLAVFCSPHNPAGRVWTREELEQAFDIFRRNEVIVISDEIWSDLIMPGHVHIPAWSLNEDASSRTIGLYAPSKTFNLAGLVGSYHIVPNGYLRDRMTAVAEKTHYNEMNVLSMHALIGAYSGQGREWLGELIQVLEKNARFTLDSLHEMAPEIRIAEPEGTYMLYLDCGDWCRAHGTTITDLIKKGWDVGVGWQDGGMFLMPDTIRLNLASPLSRIEEAMDRLKKYVF